MPCSAATNICSGSWITRQVRRSPRPWQPSASLSEEQFNLAIANLAEQARRRRCRGLQEAGSEISQKSRSQSTAKAIDIQEQVDGGLGGTNANIAPGQEADRKHIKKQVQSARGQQHGGKYSFQDEIRRHVTKETEDDEMGRMPLPSADIALQRHLTSRSFALRAGHSSRSMVQARVLADVPNVPQPTPAALQTC